MCRTCGCPACCMAALCDRRATEQSLKDSTKRGSTPCATGPWSVGSPSAKCCKAGPRDPRADVIRRGARYIDEMEDCGVDMLLAGHLHLAYHDDLRAHYKAAKRSILSVQAGTATSTRRRGEPNAYNWITVSPGSEGLCTVAVRAWNAKAGCFEESLVTRYNRVNGEWLREKQVPVDELAEKVLVEHPPAAVPPKTGL